jgi:Chlorophyll A-B binding protein.
MNSFSSIVAFPLVASWFFLVASNRQTQMSLAFQAWCPSSSVFSPVSLNTATQSRTSKIQHGPKSSSTRRIICPREEQGRPSLDTPTLGRLSMSENALQEDTATTGSSSSSSSSSMQADNIPQLDTLSQFNARPWMSNYIMDNLQQIPDEATCLQTLQQIRFSKAMPFLPRPYHLDGSMPGDYGFDPLGFVKSKEDLLFYREAEIKHSRLAMLAALGWPLSEFLNRKFASFVHLAPVVDVDGKAPNPVTEFDKINGNFWFAALVFGSIIEFYGTFRSFRKSPGYYYPGNFGFDPFGFYPKEEDEQN